MSLRDAVVGAWELESFVTRDAETGQERHPLGERPRGLLLYTADGYMSAQLATADMGEYVAYGGPFAVDEASATLHHDVSMSMLPELLTQPQFRHGHVDGELLTLSADGTDAEGVTIHARLVWRRVGTPDTP